MSPEENYEETKRLLLKTAMDLDEAIEFQQLHKTAFRIAFDFLSKSFPPVREEAYWKSTMELIGKTVNEHRENLLVGPLLMGVYNYLGEIVKDLPVKEEEESPDENRDA